MKHVRRYMQPLEELVRHASYVLTRALRGKATVYHVAPMRFAFFLLNSAPDEMEDLLLDLRDMLHAPMDAAGIPMSLTFHAGVVRFAPQQPDTNDVMRKGLVALGDAISNHAIVCWYSASTTMRSSARTGWRWMPKRRWKPAISAWCSSPGSILKTCR